METEQKPDYRVSYSLMLALEAELKCPICLEVLQNPHSTNCGHYFCKECMTNYLKETKSKCACPLCKKALNRRELYEAPKLKAIADVMQRILNESTLIQPSGFIQQTNTKKRKLNDFMESHQEYSKTVFLNRSSTNSANYKGDAQKEEAKTSTTDLNKGKGAPSSGQAERPWKSLSTSNFITEMLSKLEDSAEDETGKTPNRFHSGTYAEIQEQSTVNRNKEANSTSERNRESVNKTNHKAICLVTTALPHNLQDEVQKFCKKFKAKQYKDFNENITHMVIYPSVDNRNKIQAKRTVKYVLGVIKGIWIISFRWITDSIIREEIQNEEEYETTEDCYGVGAPRFSRINGGLQSLFKGFSFLISEGDKSLKPAIQKSELSLIIEKAGGTVLKTINKSLKNVLSITIQPIEDDLNTEGTKSPIGGKGNLISHKWVLDSVSNHTVLEYGSYLV